MKKVLVHIMLIFLLIMVITLCTSCAAFQTPSGDPTNGNSLPSSGWESTAKALAKTDWFGTFCLLSFFGGVVAIGLDQRKIGGAVIIAAIATLCLGLAIHRFPTWLAIIGFTGSIIAVGYSILIKNQALRDLIKGFQNVKEGLVDGRTDANTVMAEAQHPSTKEIVLKTKADLKKKGEIE